MISNCYDQYFQRYALEFFGDRLHWLWFKAQAVIESGLDPEAISKAGEMGVMQLMPGTAAEMAAKYPETTAQSSCLSCIHRDTHGTDTSR